VSAFIWERGDVAVGWWNMARLSWLFLDLRRREGEEGVEEGRVATAPLSAAVMSERR